MNGEAAPTTDPAEENDGDALVFMGHLVRKRHGRGFVLTEKPTRAQTRPRPLLTFGPCGPNARLRSRPQRRHRARQLAAIERGDFRDQADAARYFQLTRARITQLMNLSLLAPDLQEQVLFLETVDGREPMSERDLRTVVGAGDWAGQRAQWRELPAI